MNKNIELYHTLLDLKFGLPVSIKLKDNSYVLVCSSEALNDNTLKMMKKISNSSLSIVINNHRMGYILDKSLDDKLFSISFTYELNSDLCKNLSSSIIDNKKTMIDGAIVSFEKRDEISKMIELMKNNEIIPSLVVCNINLQNSRIEPFLKENNIKFIRHNDIINPIKDNNLEIVSRTNLPILLCKETEIVSFRSDLDRSEYFALILKKNNEQETSFLRIHSQCISGDLFDSLKCDCGSQLKSAIKMMSKEGGILLYLPQEGRNIGFLNKLRTYEFQYHGLDTIDANLALGFNSDQRNYVFASEMLKLLGVNKVHLISNNPDKVLQLEKEGINIVSSIQLKVPVSIEAKNYLHTKKKRSGHNL